MRRRLTVRALIVLVAFVSVGLAAFRLHPALGAFVSSMLLLALIRTSRWIDHLRAIGSSIGPLGVIRSFLASIVVASTILVASLLPGLCLVPIIDKHEMHSIPRFGWSTVLGIVISAIVAIPIAILMRRRLW